MAAEVLALTINFYSIFSAYLHRLSIRLGSGPQGPLLSGAGVQWTGLVATVVVLGLGIFEAVQFVRGRRWARLAMLAENAVLVVLGALWFALNRLHGVVDVYAAPLGLLLPMITLFPLLWPLSAFRPVPVAGADAQGPR